MENFDQAVEVLLAHEGGFVNDSDDAGGPTNFGLTFGDMRRLGKPATIDQIKSLTKTDAIAAYHELYWKPMNLDLIGDYHVQLVLLDQGVLQGEATIIMKLQELLGLKQDGNLGPITAASANHEDGLKLAFRLIRADMHRYNAIVKGKPSQVKFLDGWDERLFSLLDAIFFGDVT